ncbi:MAG: hypothetical protein AAFR14_11930, partial [Bacteroidota bacterium]
SGCKAGCEASDRADTSLIGDRLDYRSDRRVVLATSHSDRIQLADQWSTANASEQHGTIRNPSGHKS